MTEHTPWYTKCRSALEQWKRTTTTLPDAARSAGRVWLEERGGALPSRPYPICLPESHAEYNLVAPIRGEAQRIFADEQIAWHQATPMGSKDGPSTHLLDSQVQCVNALLSATRGHQLLGVLSTVLPDVIALEPIASERELAFEWIGAADYLGEGRGRARQRGRYCTSADAFLLVRRTSGLTGVLIEWKFTESYPKPVPFVGVGGTDRREVYRASYEAVESPFRERPPIAAFFQEPHYQLLRLALLAARAVKAGELGMQEAVVLHLIPEGNRSLLETVPAPLARYGADVSSVWSHLLPGPQVQYLCADTRPFLEATPEVWERYGAAFADPQ